jgi:formylmethanofuran dehydrogenase subunit B
LLCDGFEVEAADSLVLVGSDCPRARAGLAQFTAEPSVAQPQVGGRNVPLDTAVAEASRLLAQARQPLFGGLGTDVAGARSLYALACETGAIADAAQGDALFHGLRALQDRGGFTTTLAEVRTRADLLLCLTGDPAEHYPEFFNRVGSAAQVLHPPLQGDLFDTLGLLAALVEGLPLVAPPAALVALAERLQAARYAVLVYETGRLPAHGALIVEAIGRIVGTLNRRTRAAALPLGGGDGASTVNQVFTWLSGLPLRSRAGPAGLEHEPVRFAAGRVLAGSAADALLWVQSFGAQALAPAGVPRIVLGHPALAGGADAVFIPVSTPGIGSAGHVFRTDGSVLMPLRPAVDDTLPTVADVVKRLTLAVKALRPEAA